MRTHGERISSRMPRRIWRMQTRRQRASASSTHRPLFIAANSSGLATASIFSLKRWRPRYERAFAQGVCFEHHRIRSPGCHVLRCDLPMGVSPGPGPAPGPPVRRRPVLFAGLLNAFGHKGPAEIERKRRFTYELCTWTAQELGNPVRNAGSAPI